MTDSVIRDAAIADLGLHLDPVPEVVANSEGVDPGKWLRMRHSTRSETMNIGIFVIW